MKINTTGFPEYVVPDGTRIPIGVYQVGADIPPSNYILSFSGEGYATIDIYKNKENYDKNYESFWTTIDAIDNQIAMTLEEGNFITVKNSAIIMKKGTVNLSFD